MLVAPSPRSPLGWSLAPCRDPARPPVSPVLPPTDLEVSSASGLGSPHMPSHLPPHPVLTCSFPPSGPLATRTNVGRVEGVGRQPTGLGVTSVFVPRAPLCPQLWAWPFCLPAYSGLDRHRSPSPSTGQCHPAGPNRWSHDSVPQIGMLCLRS